MDFIDALEKARQACIVQGRIAGIPKMADGHAFVVEKTASELVHVEPRFSRRKVRNGTFQFENSRRPAGGHQRAANHDKAVSIRKQRGSYQNSVTEEYSVMPSLFTGRRCYMVSYGCGYSIPSVLFLMHDLSRQRRTLLRVFDNHEPSHRLVKRMEVESVVFMVRRVGRDGFGTGGRGCIRGGGIGDFRGGGGCRGELLLGM